MTTQSTDERTNWGRWGDDDERGALNLLTPERVRAGAAAVTTGKVYSLGIPIQSSGVPLLDYRGTPMRAPRTSPVSAAAKSGTGSDALVASAVSAPAMTLSASAASCTVSVSGPI